MTSDLQMPVAEGLFVGAGIDAHLIGSRCDGCGAHYFPRSLSCRNPACTDKQVHDTRLGRRGTLYSYTLQSFRPPPLFRMDDWSPYLLGLVELPEGLRVMGMLCGCSREDLRIGMEMELVLEPLHRDDAGRDVMTYKFRPAAATGASA